MNARQYQVLAVVTVVAVLVLIAIGSLVRTTASGLGCPDWPRCHGAWFPPLEKEPVIEYTHRTAAAIVGALVVMVAGFTYIERRGDRALVALATASLVVLAFQAYLGKVTVELELPPWIVTSHMATALVLLALLCAITALAYLGPGREVIRTPERASLMRVLTLALVVTYAVLLWGAYVVKSPGASTACLSWPGCPLAPIPFVDNAWPQLVHWVHRLSVLVGAGVIGWVAYALRKEAPALRRGGRALMWLYLVQILIGASNIWTDFSEAALVAHLAVGATIWAVLVLTAVAARYRSEREAERAVPAARWSRRQSAHA